MKLQLNFLFFMILSSFTIKGQDAVHNYGTIQIHDQALVGFHTNLVNDGPFNQNLGFVGFYDEVNELTISGTSNPVFYDTEIVVDNGLYIENTVGILKSLNLVSGIIYTPRTASEVNLNFITDAEYFGETDLKMVDGYVSMIGKSEFTFPVGDNQRIRPLTISSSAVNDYAKGGYYYEDPNSPSIFGTSFNTASVENVGLLVSNYEFWHLEGEVPSNVTLTWSSESFTFLLGDTINDLRVVGWNIVTKQWENLGAVSFSGNLETGHITSSEFIPNDYEIITVGGLGEGLETLSSIDLGNYYVSPNGDGINDRLKIEGIENSLNNSIEIYDRYGILVYSKENYTNEFDGISNRQSVIDRKTGLASGLYYYIIHLKDISQRSQGYFYLTTTQE